MLVLAFAVDLPLGQYSKLIKTGQMNRAKSWNEFKAAVVNYRTWIMLLEYGYCFGIELTASNILSTYFYDQFQLTVSKASLWASVFGYAPVFLFPSVFACRWFDVSLVTTTTYHHCQCTINSLLCTV